MMLNYDDEIEIISTGESVTPGTGSPFLEDRLQESVFDHTESVFAQEISPDDSISHVDFMPCLEDETCHLSYMQNGFVERPNGYNDTTRELGIYGHPNVYNVHGRILTPRHLKLLAKRLDPDVQRKYIARTVAVYFIVIVTISVALVTITLYLSRNIDKKVETESKTKTETKGSFIKNLVSTTTKTVPETQTEKNLMIPRMDDTNNGSTTIKTVPMSSVNNNISTTNKNIGDG